MNEVLTSAEMAAADRRTISSTEVRGYWLMRNAGQAVADIILCRFPWAGRVDVLCGPGNNGGDGYVIATVLAAHGIEVHLWEAGEPRTGTDAAQARADCPLPIKPLAEFAPTRNGLIVDALFGAGLDRPIEGAVLAAVEAARTAHATVLAVDLPTGISGDTGAVLGDAFHANLTVTFARKKPGHLLYQGRTYCGETIVAEIGIPDRVIAGLGVATSENLPGNWLHAWPRLAVDAYKYTRGHVGVLSGSSSAGSAARMSAMAAARTGAGAVTLLSPADALPFNAPHLTSIILRECGSTGEILAFLESRKPQAFVYGPGLSPTDSVRQGVIDILANPVAPATLVLDADGITASAKDPDALFAAAQGSATTIILTPHDGEFARLFPDISGSRLTRARAAAQRSGCVVVLKGPDTVIAAADGRASINSNGTPLLATAGSGDVLSGIIASLAAQGMPPFEAACAGVWLHAEAAAIFGIGLIADDLPMALLPVLRQISQWIDP